MGHKYPPPTRFKINRNYTVQELARMADVHENTIRNWIDVGLTPIDDHRPIYITGSEMRRFLTMMRQSVKSPCMLEEMYCLSCRQPRPPMGGMADLLETEAGARLTGICPVCEKVMHKRVSVKSIPLLAAKLDIHRQIRPTAGTSIPTHSGVFVSLSDL